ncbi:hypothetical protein HG263_19530 [Pseudoalteromonas sp. JBTF-M23]|uniref:Uncharacterized protein n=1 Tax=Pseudoalteromonas caenipelagi TaxID=2726988 RepID=A0A849VM04_9GAMM|nr:hypothetical protein [Pseudoalteromonas caenipelagi]NOU52701.1 hypothetical protein [Pseudoalteromonas caenipelagi]
MKLLKAIKATKKQQTANLGASQSLELSAKVLSNKELLAQVGGARGGGYYPPNPPKSTSF